MAKKKSTDTPTETAPANDVTEAGPANVGEVTSAAGDSATVEMQTEHSMGETTAPETTIETVIEAEQHNPPRASADETQPGAIQGDGAGDFPSPADVEAHAVALKDFSEGAALATGRMMGPDAFAAALSPEDAAKIRADLSAPDVDETTDPGTTIDRVQTWNPTHRIRTADSVTPIMLKDDEAFTFEEWIGYAPLAQIFRVVDAEGRESWERDGEPVEGVFKIED